METLIEIQNRILCDTLPADPLEAVFLFGQTADNQASVFRAAKEMLDQGKTKKILIIQRDAVSGYPGYQKWLEDLSEEGIELSQVEGVSSVESMLHTRIESEALIDHILRKSYQQVGVCAAPFQQLRAFMTAVSVALEKMPFVQLYSVPGKPLDWTKEVKHSQGTLMGTRADLIHGEIERIGIYQKKGDLADSDLVLGYLNKRG